MLQLLLKKVFQEPPKKATKHILDFGCNKLNNKNSSAIGSGLRLRINEVKGIIKVIKSLENRRILLKRNTKKVMNQKENSLVMFFVH